MTGATSIQPNLDGDGVPPTTAVRLMAPTRRRASVGACLLPATPEKGRIMAGLPVSLAIAIWFVAALWIVGAVGYYFDYSAEFIWLTPFLAMGVALAEWRLTKNSDDANSG